MQVVVVKPQLDEVVALFKEICSGTVETKQVEDVSVPTGKEQQMEFVGSLLLDGKVKLAAEKAVKFDFTIPELRSGLAGVRSAYNEENLTRLARGIGLSPRIDTQRLSTADWKAMKGR